MDFSQLLNQVLGAAQKGGKAVADSPLNSFGGGALTGALASMLLKKKNTKKLVKAGSVAALGFLAYKAIKTGNKTASRTNCRKVRSNLPV